MIKNKTKFVIGIDEVGRGPVAGPVTVCAVLMSEYTYKKFKKSHWLKKLRDSKALSNLGRRQWFKQIKRWRNDGILDYALSSLSSNKIDKIGISSAILKCLNNNLEKLEAPFNARILLDGSLFAPKEFKYQKTIIKGDVLEPIISLASIVAKVSRDDWMIKISKKIPQYFFEQHKGYGTKKHFERIKKIGLSNIHRKTFLRGLIVPD